MPRQSRGVVRKKENKIDKRLVAIELLRWLIMARNAILVSIIMGMLIYGFAQMGWLGISMMIYGGMVAFLALLLMRVQKMIVYLRTKYGIEKERKVVM